MQAKNAPQIVLQCRMTSHAQSTALKAVTPVVPVNLYPLHILTFSKDKAKPQDR